MRNLINKLSILSYKKQILFGACCAERMLPCYKYFEAEIATESNEYLQRFKRGHIELEALLERIFQFLANKQAQSQTENHEVYANLCLDFAPDTEKISSYNAVLAQNCAIGLSYAYAAIAEESTEKIRYCSNKTIESVDIIGSMRSMSSIDIEKIIRQEEEVQDKYISIINSLQRDFIYSDIKELRDFNRLSNLENLYNKPN